VVKGSVFFRLEILRRMAALGQAIYMPASAPRRVSLWRPLCRVAGDGRPATTIKS